MKNQNYLKKKSNPDQEKENLCLLDLFLMCFQTNKELTMNAKKASTKCKMTTNILFDYEHKPKD